MSMQSSREGRCRSGFTLIELLVVIAILSILATLLLPTLGEARKLARQTACISNTRGLGVGIAMYATEDRSGSWPYFGNGWWTAQVLRDDKTGWLGLGKLWAPTNYVEEYALFACPNHEGKSEQFATYDWNASTGYVQPSYSLRGWEQVKWPKTPPGKELASASQFALVSCFMMHHSIWGTTQTSQPLHEDGYPVLFGDGHAKNIPAPIFVTANPTINIWDNSPYQTFWWDLADGSF